MNYVPNEPDLSKKCFFPIFIFTATAACFPGSFFGLQLAGSTLHLNAKADFGTISVLAEDAEGRIIGESEPINADGVDLPVKWKADPNLSGPISLRFRLENARLFAFWVN